MATFISDFLPPEAQEARKPDQDYVEQIARDLYEDATAQRRIDQEIRNFVFGLNTISMPQQYRQAGDPVVHSGMASMTLDNIRGMWSKQPQFRIPVPDISRTALGADPREQSTKIEDFLNASFSGFSKRGLSTHEMAIWDMMAYGRGWTRQARLEHRYAAKTIEQYYPGEKLNASRGDVDKRTAYQEYVDAHRRHIGVPVDYRHVPTRGVYAGQDSDGISEVIEVEARRLSSVLQDYLAPELGPVADIEAERLASQVRFVHFANRQHHAYFLAGKADFPEKESDQTSELGKLTPLYRKKRSPRTGRMSRREGLAIPHGLGDAPYTPFYGLPTSDRDPEKRYLSVLYHMRPLIQSLDTLLTQQGSFIRVWYWPTLQIKVPETRLTNAADRPEDIPIVPGQPLMTWGDEQISFLLVPQGAPEADKHLQLILRQLDRMGLAPANFGVDLRDASSGYALTTLIRAAQTKYAPLGHHIRRAYHHDAMMYLRQVSLLSGEDNQPVYVSQIGSGEDGRRESRSLGLTRKDLDGPWQLEVDLEMDLPNDQIAMGQHWRAMEREGYVDRHYVREQIGIPDPQRMEERVLLQNWRDDERVRTALVEELLARMSTKRQEAVAERASQIAPGGGALPLPPALMSMMQQRGIQPDPRAIAAPGAPQSPEARAAIAAARGVPNAAGAAAAQRALDARSNNVPERPGRAPGVGRRPGGPQGLPAELIR